MKFESVRVDQFGVLFDVSFTEFDVGINVVYGSNGSGKTTWLQFVRGTLCGFSESRRRALLTHKDTQEVGSVQVATNGQKLRLRRSAGSDRLQVASIPSHQSSTTPPLDVDGMRSDLFRDLHTASGSTGPAIERLIQQALIDGVPLVDRREGTARLNQAAVAVHHQRTALLTDTGTGRLPELAEQRRRLQEELQQLREVLHGRCRQWERQFAATSDQSSQEQAKVKLLQNELAAAQCDLREAEDRAWAFDPVPPTLRLVPRSRRRSSDPFIPPHREHITVRRIPQLKRLERQIDLVRSLLAETAHSRLAITLRAARIAGTEDTSTGPFLEQMRESLAALEFAALAFRDNTESLSAECRPGTCACNQWEANSSEAVHEISRRIYRLCEEVSRYELNHEKSRLSRALVTIDEIDQALQRHLESLRGERSALLNASPGLRAWSASQRAKVKQEHCRCLEHDLPAEPSRSRKPEKAAGTVPEKMPAVPHDAARQSPDDLARLRQRCELLSDQLHAAVIRWREVRNRRPSLSLPEDLRALEREVDEKRMDLGAVEAWLNECQQRWRVLSVTGEVIRRAVQQIEQNQQSDVIRWASEYLRRLTAGRLVEIHVSREDHLLRVFDVNGSSRSVADLSCGTRGQLELSLRLALVRAYAQRGIQFPLVWDDAMVDTDQQRLRAAVELLREFAAEYDQQIIYLTCHTHLAEILERHGATIFTMPGSSRLSYREVTGIERPTDAIQGWVDRTCGNEVVPAEPTTIERPIPGQAAVQAAEPSETNVRNVRLLRPLQRRQVDSPYWLSLDSPVDLIPSIGSQMGRRLAGLGVTTVGKLIDLQSENLALRLASLQIAPERLSDWRVEAELLCRVPDLTGSNAQLLVFSGIRDVEALSQADVDQLYARISHLTAGDRRLLFEGAPVNRDLIRRWIFDSRRARRLPVGRRGSQGRRRTANRRRRSTPSRRGHRARSSRSGESSRVRRLRRAPSRSQQTRHTFDRRIESFETGNQAFTRDVSRFTDELASADVRFYLSPHSPVVDAPSIGPTTARLFEKIGVLTVADLMNRDAEEIATRLKNRRIKEQTVQVWQQQARLMCRIPQLRGHDAQVLIACGLTEPEQLANMSPSELFALVGPFVATKEGQRLLRSANTPDLEEVTDWISWSRHSRPLRAA